VYSANEVRAKILKTHKINNTTEWENGRERKKKSKLTIYLLRIKQYTDELKKYNRRVYKYIYIVRVRTRYSFSFS